jgi:hypothetical protein
LAAKIYIAAQPKRGSMCDECDEIQTMIDQHREFLQQLLDPLTSERIGVAIADLEWRKHALHFGERPPCPNCAMRMIVKSTRL